MCLSFGAWGKTIVVYGDSLSAAYGIAEKRGWVALLAERLKRSRWAPTTACAACRWRK